MVVSYKNTVAYLRIKFTFWQGPFMSAWFSGVGQFLGDACVLVVDLGAVVPVEAPHLGVHDALVGGGKHLGRGHVLVVPRVAVAEITCKY